jgi:hypothetical protein
MTYNDALNFKRQLGKDHIIQNGMTMMVFVTPADSRDFTEYMTDYRGGYFTDDTSKQYCSNGQYKVHALYTDGTNVIHNDLTK